MLENYNKKCMSSKTKIVYERGKFFIETGTARSFKNYLQRSANGFQKYIPKILLKRIENLMDRGDVDSAVTLWMKVCNEVDIAPAKRLLSTVFILSYFVIAAMAIYSFFHTFLNP